MATCLVPSIRERSLFWATVPDACGEGDTCGYNCGRPGLNREGASISTEDWIRGLMINILMTDGRQPDNDCGYRPGGQGGHWSESYGNVTIGSLIRTVPPTSTVNESALLLRAHAESSLVKLVTYRVALRVEVSSSYVGNGVFSIEAKVYGVSNTIARVGLSARRYSNAWIWS